MALKYTKLKPNLGSAMLLQCELDVYITFLTFNVLIFRVEMKIPIS